MKTCSTCKLDKPEDDFYWRNKAKTVRQDYCKACKTEYNRTWYNKNKDKHKADVERTRTGRVQKFYDFINEVKSVPCADCQGVFPSVCMDFDHLSDDKLYNIAEMMGHSLEKVKVEVAKCEVVCANCHRIRTAERFRSSVDRIVPS